MTEWGQGYVRDVPYTYGYFPAINPLNAGLMLLYDGLVPPVGRRACELGYGQGVTLNLLAAGQDTEWWGTDFNATHAALAGELAEQAAAGARLSNRSFADFCTDPDLPEFDFIALNGVWSWINDDNRALLVDFVRRKLAVGGVFYLNYLAQPGHADMVPVQRLLTQYDERLGKRGQDRRERILDALAFAEQLLGADARYALNHPGLLPHLREIRTQMDPAYLVHEYFSRIWQPMTFAEVATWLQPAGLEYAGSAFALDHVPSLTLTPKQRQLLADIPDSVLRETARDFLYGRAVHLDYWVKGPRPLPHFQREAAWRQQRFVLIRPRGEIGATISLDGAEVGLVPAIYTPLLDALADQQPKTFGELERLLKPAQLRPEQLREACLLLVGAGLAAPAQVPEVIERRRGHTDRLNRHLLARARDGGEIGFLASPVTGGGIAVPRLGQLFLLAAPVVGDKPEDWATFVWDILAARGEKLIKDGKPLANAKDPLAELRRQAREFADKELPLLRSLQVVA